MRLLPERAEYEFFIYDPSASDAGIDANEYDEGLSVFPNPTSAILNISGTEAQKLHCELYSMMGKKVLERDFWGASASMQISELQAGAYILKVNNQTFKVLKK